MTTVPKLKKSTPGSRAQAPAHLIYSLTDAKRGPPKKATGKRHDHDRPLPPPDPELRAHGLVVNYHGAPKPMPRPRFRRGDGHRLPVSITGGARIYSQALEVRIKEAVLNLGGHDLVRSSFAGQALLVRIVFGMPTRHEERWGTPHYYKPDADNLVKLVMDVAMRAGAFGGDDCKVARIEAMKEWDSDGYVWLQVIPVESASRSETRSPEERASDQRTGEILHTMFKGVPRWLRK